jgi:hypothetical protein
MPTFLFTVDDVFDISGRYIIPTPGVPVSVRGIRNGLLIELRRQTARYYRRYASVLMFDPFDLKRPTQIALQGITKHDVPAGTEITRDETPVA